MSVMMIERSHKDEPYFVWVTGKAFLMAFFRGLIWRRRTHTMSGMHSRGWRMESASTTCALMSPASASSSWLVGTVVKLFTFKNGVWWIHWPWWRMNTCGSWRWNWSRDWWRISSLLPGFQNRLGAPPLRLLVGQGWEDVLMWLVWTGPQRKPPWRRIQGANGSLERGGRKVMARGSLVDLWGYYWNKRPWSGVKVKKKRRRKGEAESVAQEAEAAGGRRRGAARRAEVRAAGRSQESRQVIFACPLPGGRTNFGGSAKSTPGGCWKERWKSSRGTSARCRPKERPKRGGWGTACSGTSIR